MTKTDVLIIGGGIIGCSIAYYLAKEGIETVVVEEDDIASGTSGACDGFIFLQSKPPGINLELALTSARLYENLSAELGCELEYRKCGGMVVAENQQELTYLEDLAKRQDRHGLKVQVLSAKEARSKVPQLAPHITGASFCPEDAQVNPILTSFAFSKAAQNKGARIITGTAVKEMEIIEKGQETWVIKVVTNQGKIKANMIINTAGIDAAQIARMIQVDLPITPRRGQILVTEPLPRILDCLITNVSYISSKSSIDTDVSQQTGVTFEQTESGNLLIGSTREFVGYNKNTSYEGLTTIARNAAELMPQCASLNVIRSFAGLRPTTPDNLAILGPLNGVKNVIIASGHGGDGIALAPITGKLMAELIVKGKTSIDISKLNPNRFEQKETDNQKK